MQNIRAKAMPAKYWSSAGIMLTDWCCASCASCYLRCSPRGKNWMSVDSAVDIWQQLESLSPHGCKIHLTGGEPFGDWERLLAVARKGQAEKLTLYKVETNAYWATDDKIIRDRIKALDEAGMQKFSISADPFHQQFVPIDRPRLAAEVATKILGPARVQVRWQRWLETGCDLAEFSVEERNRLFVNWLIDGRDRHNGRAAEMLAGMLTESLQSPEAFAGLNCSEGLLRGKQIHVDPTGCIMPGVCAGLMLGRADVKPIADIWRDIYDFAENLQSEPARQGELEDQRRPVLSALASGGPYCLMKLAQREGFVPSAGYASKCHLCWSVRNFLYRNTPNTAGELGPDGVYSEEQLPANT